MKKAPRRRNGNLLPVNVARVPRFDEGQHPIKKEKKSDHEARPYVATMLYNTTTYDQAKDWFITKDNMVLCFVIDLNEIIFQIWYFCPC